MCTLNGLYNEDVNAFMLSTLVGFRCPKVCHYVYSTEFLVAISLVVTLSLSVVMKRDTRRAIGSWASRNGFIQQGFSAKFATGGGFWNSGWARIEVFPLHQMACHVVLF